MGDLGEIVGFLDHERPDVRKMAVDGIAGMSTDERMASELVARPALLLRLVGLLEDQPVRG